MELTLQLEQIWVFLQREGRGRWGVSCSINTCWIELLERQRLGRVSHTSPRLTWSGFSHVWSPHTVPPLLTPLFSYLHPTPPHPKPKYSFLSVSKSLFSCSSWPLGLKPSWCQRRGISMDVIARPVVSLPTHLKPEGDLGSALPGQSMETANI